MLQVQPCRALAVAVIAFLAVTAASLSGCTSVQPPQIALMDVRLGDRTEQATRVEFVMSLANPNNQPVQLLEVHYRLDLDGSTVFTGRRATQTTLPARGETQVIVPAVVTAEQAAQLGDQYDMRGRLNYVLPGRLAEALLDIGLRRPQASFAFDGRLPVASGSTP